MFAVFFAVEGRIFFLVALLSLVFTVVSLALYMTVFAERSSIIVYLALVLGVVAEIGAPFFSRWHQGSPAMIRVSREFITGYYHALSDYAGMIVIGLQSLFVIALIGRGFVWSFDYQMLLYIVMGVWGFAIVYLLTRDTICHLQDIYSLSRTRTDLVSIWHQVTHIESTRERWTLLVSAIALLGAGLLAWLIDWTAVAALPMTTLISLILLILLIITALSGLYHSSNQP